MSLAHGSCNPEIRVLIPLSVKSGRSLVFCRNSSCVVDDLQFVLEHQCPPTAVGAIENQVVVSSHNASEEKPLNAFRFEFAGQIHGNGQIGLVETCQPHRFAGLRRSESGKVQYSLQLCGHGEHFRQIVPEL